MIRNLQNLYNEKLLIASENLRNKPSIKTRKLRSKIQTDLSNINNLEEHDSKFIKYYLDKLNTDYKDIDYYPDNQKFNKKLVNVKKNLHKKLIGGNFKNDIKILITIILKIYLDENYKLSNTNKEYAKRIINTLKGAGIFDSFQSLMSNFLDRFKGKRLNSFNRESSNVLNKYGNQKIKYLVIAKKPIHDLLDKFINILSIGQWNKLKNKFGFDKLMHLCLIAVLDNDTKIYIEKIDAVTISLVDKISSNETEYLEIDNIGDLTLSNFINGSRSYLNNDNLYFDYDPWTNNCQIFLKYLLESIGKYGIEEKNFIFQDVSNIAKQMPSYTKTIMKGITDLGQISNRFLGKGDTLRGGKKRGTIQEEMMKRDKDKTKFDLIKQSQIEAKQAENARELQNLRNPQYDEYYNEMERLQKIREAHPEIYKNPNWYKNLSEREKAIMDRKREVANKQYFDAMEARNRQVQAQLDAEEAQRNSGGIWDTLTEGLSSGMEAGLNAIMPGVGSIARSGTDALISDLRGYGNHKLTLKQTDRIGKKLNINFNIIPNKYWNYAMNIEAEHNNITKGNLTKTGQIALTHLKESPRYYIELKKMEHKLNIK